MTCLLVAQMKPYKCKAPRVLGYVLACGLACFGFSFCMSTVGSVHQLGLTTADL